MIAKKLLMITNVLNPGPVSWLQRAARAGTAPHWERLAHPRPSSQGQGPAQAASPAQEAASAQGRASCSRASPASSPWGAFRWSCRRGRLRGLLSFWFSGTKSFISTFCLITNLLTIPQYSRTNVSISWDIILRTVHVQCYTAEPKFYLRFVDLCS